MPRLPDRAAETAVTIDGGRRAPRALVPDCVFVDVDGESVMLIDFSFVGAQLVTTRQMRPEQRIRLLLPGADVWIGARVVRSSLEPGRRSRVLQYRVAVEYEEPEQVRSVLERFQTDLDGIS